MSIGISIAEGQNRYGESLGRSAETAGKNARATNQQFTAKYLVFALAGEEFGIQISKVREIIGIQKITPVPQAPECVTGIINLRGKVIPVIDLRMKFALPQAEYAERACIVILGIVMNETPIAAGILVDSVSEVLTIASSDIDECPRFTSDSESNYLFGMAKIKDRVTILLDIDRVFQNSSILPSVR